MLQFLAEKADFVDRSMTVNRRELGTVRASCMRLPMIQLSVSPQRTLKNSRKDGNRG